MKLQINLLGSLHVTVGGKTAVFRTDAQRVLLAYLATHQGIPQRRDTVSGLLSPDRSDKEALTYLRNRLTRLRDTVGDDMAVPPWFEIDRKQITLRTGSDIVIDSIQFEQHLNAIETHPHRQLAGCPTCLAKLQTAVNLVRGELLAGLNFPSDTWEAWLTNQREHVQQRALEAMTLLRDARLVTGEWTAVLDIAQRQLSFEPWLESAHRAIMEARTHLGDRNAALAQFAQCQQQLWDELGIEPEEETISLFEKIKSDEENSSLIRQPVVGHPSSFPNNLPLQTGHFFGRQAEQTQLLERLVDPAYRLITVVGTGGIGKTRLSIEVGRQVQMSFPDGVWFVQLEAIKGGAEQIQIAVGEAIGLAQDDKQLTGEQVIAILRDKQILLIFDNSEVALDDIGFIPDWLRRAPHIAILATSREPLNFQAESVITLAGLPTGILSTDRAEMSAAEALFAERAQMARDDFTVAADKLPQVRQICELVDGSPLGISLAAAWVRRRSLSQIIAEIGHSLDFLSTRLRDVDPRHRSMRAVFETSWQLLSPVEQQILAALSVFPASFTAVSATQITGATLFDLDLLCEKSLLQQQIESERYIMHSLVRQFAADKLAAHTPEVDHAFVDHFYHFAHNHQDDYAVLQPEWGNLATAVSKAHTLQLWPDVIKLVQALDEPWFRQIRFQEMRQGLTFAVDAAKALQDQPALARTLLRLGEIEVELNDYAQAETHLTEAMQLLMHEEDSLGIAQGKYLYGRLKQEQTEDDDALVLFEQSRTIFEGEGNLLGVAKNLNLIAVCQFKLYRDYLSAQSYLEQALKLQSQQPRSSFYIETLRYLARVHLMLAAYEEAEQYLVTATDISKQLNNLGEYAAILYEHVLLCKKRQQLEKAVTFGYECLQTFKHLGSLRWEALIKTQLGLLHQAKNEPLQGLQLLTDGLEIFNDLGDLYEQAYSYFYLYKLYAEIGETEQSLNARQKANQINLVLNIPGLAQRLN